jgi:hypothetical protein
VSLSQTGTSWTAEELDRARALAGRAPAWFDSRDEAAVDRVTDVRDVRAGADARGSKLYSFRPGQAEACRGVAGGLLSRQQRTKSWMTGLVSAAGGQATPTWLGLIPVTGR